MWEYNFSDYKLFCHMFGYKENQYSNLMKFKKFIKYVEEERGI